MSITPTTVCATNHDDLDRRLKHPGVDHPELVGSPDAIVSQLSAYAKAGATKAYLRLVDLHDLDHIEVLGAEVLPRIHEKIRD